MDTSNIINGIVETIVASVIESTQLKEVVQQMLKELGVEADDVDGLENYITEALNHHVVEADDVAGLDEFIANQIDSEIESQLDDKFNDMTIPKDNVENLAEELDAMDDKIDDAIARLKVLENGGSSEGRLSEIDRLKVRNEQLETRVGSLEYALNAVIADITARQQEIADQLTNSIEALKGTSSLITKI